MQTLEYIQLGTVGRSLILPVGRSGKLVHQDNKTKERKQIRHCRNEDSPFVKEQSDFASVDPIIFVQGVFKATDNEKVTQMFMDLHPGNKKNGGRIFVERNAEEEAKDGLVLEDYVIDLKYQAKKAEKDKNGFIKLQALASVLEGSYNLIKSKSASELRQIVNNKIDDAPMSFVDDDGEAELFNEDILRKFMAIQAIDREVVEVSADGRSIRWNSGKTIVNVPAGRKPQEYFAEYLATDDGSLITKELETKL